MFLPHVTSPGPTCLIITKSSCSLSADFRTNIVLIQSQQNISRNHDNHFLFYLFQTKKIKLAEKTLGSPKFLSSYLLPLKSLTLSTNFLSALILTNVRYCITYLLLLAYLTLYILLWESSERIQYQAVLIIIGARKDLTEISYTKI